MKKFHFAVYIGRFQPFHLGHLATVKQALEDADHVVIVLGSSNVAPNIKNPFTAAERESTIRHALGADSEHVSFVRVRDYLYDDAKWVNEVYCRVSEVTGHDKEVALIGYHKDSSSYYLDLFPSWRFIHATPKHTIDATHVRHLYFENKGFAHLVPEAVESELQHFRINTRFGKLQDEYEFIKNYRAAWKDTPYPPTFVTTDAVVIQKNQVLVVERKENPGKGLWALPGGFIKDTETILKSAVRELREETCILIPEQDLLRALTEVKVFDHPGRSLRGRTITHAHCFNLAEKLAPRVVGADDAARARWISFGDVYKYEDEFYEDHHQIVSYFIEKR